MDILKEELKDCRVELDELEDDDVRCFCNVCHGSGINGTWNTEERKNHFVLRNSFHCMDENGMYDGWADFWIKLPKNEPNEFDLHFTGRAAHYLNNKYMLREYLEDTVAHFIEFVWPTTKEMSKENG